VVGVVVVLTVSVLTRPKGMVKQNCVSEIPYAIPVSSDRVVPLLGVE
jgi:hypothetical protein